MKRANSAVSGLSEAAAAPLPALPPVVPGLPRRLASGEPEPAPPDTCKQPDVRHLNPCTGKGCASLLTGAAAFNVCAVELHHVAHRSRRVVLRCATISTSDGKSRQALQARKKRCSYAGASARGADKAAVLDLDAVPARRSERLIERSEDVSEENQPGWRIKQQLPSPGAWLRCTSPRRRPRLRRRCPAQTRSLKKRPQQASESHAARTECPYQERQ